MKLFDWVKNEQRSFIWIPPKIGEGVILWKLIDGRVCKTKRRSPVYP